MKRIKLIALLSLVIVTSIMMVGCNNDDEELTGTFYSLQKAYDEGYLTVRNLQSIANYQYTAYPKTLSPRVEAAIKETCAESLRTNEINPFPEATAEDISIDRYYGTLQ